MNGNSNLTPRATRVGDQVRMRGHGSLNGDGLALRVDDTQLGPSSRPTLVWMRALRVTPSSRSL
jgi:hypothetical protein